MKLFVWDFHGVLEKDNEKAVIEISNRVLTAAGFKDQFTEADNERYYGLKWYEYFERLLPNLTHQQHLELQTRCFQFAEQHLEILAKHIKPGDHAADVLTKIKDSNHQQIVISNTRQPDLVWFINAVGIQQFFDDNHIVGVNAHEQHGSKSEALKSYLKGKHFEQIVVIGDSDDDVELGKSIGATTYFYKHPHRLHSPDVQADHIIHDLREVLGAI